MTKKQTSELLARPVVYDFTSPAAFLRELLTYYQRRQKGFSIRARLREHPGCSPAMISLMLKGQRRLTRDFLPLLTQVFQLMPAEVEYLDGLLSARFPIASREVAPVKREARNHLLSDWIYVYVKDTVNLRHFRADPDALFVLLGGLASRTRLQKAIEFLYREGFWRKTAQGKTVPDESLARTTSGVAVTKIRQFHKAALEIARKGLDKFPPARRKAYATVVSVDREGLEELHTLVDHFHQQLQEFVERHPEGRDQLCQVIVHLTPLGGDHV